MQLELVPRLSLAFAVLVGCAATPPAGSLAAIRQEADRAAMERCLKTQFTSNRHVPALTLADACARAVYRRDTGRAPANR